jgi:hypothetical protein
MVKVGVEVVGGVAREIARWAKTCAGAHPQSPPTKRYARHHLQNPSTHDPDGHASPLVGSHIPPRF